MNVEKTNEHRTLNIERPTSKKDALRLFFLFVGKELNAFSIQLAAAGVPEFKVRCWTFDVRCFVF